MACPAFMHDRPFFCAAMPFEELTIGLMIVVEEESDFQLPFDARNQSSQSTPVKLGGTS